MDLNQVTVPCADYAASVAFYRALGLRQIVANPPDYARFECPEGGSTISLHRVETPPAAGVVVYFEVPDVDAALDTLREAGITPESGPTDQPWLWREALLRDPAGNPVCLYHAGRNRRFPPWRLGAEAEPEPGS
jgi:catechol 2,3-dioxygenase-like lactoylglutathione lyase family enzyme